MKITSIRIRKLVSTEQGFGHNAIEIEAAVEENDNYEHVVAAVQKKVEEQLARIMHKDSLSLAIHELQDEVHRLEREKNRLERLNSELRNNKNDWDEVPF